MYDIVLYVDFQCVFIVLAGVVNITCIGVKYQQVQWNGP